MAQRAYLVRPHVDSLVRGAIYAVQHLGGACNKQRAIEERANKGRGASAQSKEQAKQRASKAKSKLSKEQAKQRGSKAKSKQR
eukprot:8736970-Pyramimonas_sp.AAC.1